MDCLLKCKRPRQWDEETAGGNFKCPYYQRQSHLPAEMCHVPQTISLSGRFIAVSAVGPCEFIQVLSDPSVFDAG